MSFAARFAAIAKGFKLAVLPEAEAPRQVQFAWNVLF
jgi:hypothetical protein